jgi:hypothetical protein
MQELERVVDAPPVGEQIHMPAPSRLPILNATGISIAIVGITISLVLVIGGAVLFLVTTLIWVRKAVRELDELPAEHGDH